MGGTNHQFQVGKMIKNFAVTSLIIIFMLLGNSVSAGDCPKDPLPVSPELHRVLTRAEKEMEKGHNQKALRLLADYARKNASKVHPQLLFLRGLVNYRLKRFNDSETFFKEAVKLDPCFGEAWQNLAAVRYEQKRLAEAAEAMIRAFSLIRPENPDLQYQTAVFWLMAKETKKAISLLKGLCARPNPSPRWRASLAHVLETLKKNDKAAKVLASRNAAGKASADRFRSALLHLKDGAPQKALPILTKLAANANPNAQWLIVLASTLDKLDRPKEALAVMEKVDLNASALSSPGLSSPDLSSKMRLQVAIFWLNHDHPKRALNLLEKLAKNPRASKSCRVALIEALVRTGKPQAANVPLKGLLDRYPQDEQIWRLAAWTAIEQKDYGNAAAALEVAFRLDPPKHGGWKRLGNLYRLAGVPRKAAEAYTRAFGETPTARDLDLLACTHTEAHQMEYALTAAGRAASLAPTAKRFSRLGRMYMKQRDFAKGMAAFQKAAQLDDQGGINSLRLGYAAWKLDQLASAKTAFQSVLQKADSGSQTASKASRALKTIEQVMNNH
jgi:tetratricopeptide (TPR) repeat protein